MFCFDLIGFDLLRVTGCTVVRRGKPQAVSETRSDCRKDSPYVEDERTGASDERAAAHTCMFHVWPCDHSKCAALGAVSGGHSADSADRPQKLPHHTKRRV